METDRQELADETMERWKAHGSPEFNAKFLLNEWRLNLLAARKRGDIKAANDALRFMAAIIGALRPPKKQDYVRRTPRGLAQNFKNLNEWLGEVINKTSE